MLGTRSTSINLGEAVIIFFLNLVEQFLDVFLILTPIEFDINFFLFAEFACGVMLDILAEKLLIVGWFASRALLAATISAGVVSGNRNQ